MTTGHTHVTAMARCLPSRQPVAYVGVRPELPPAWPGLLHAIRCELPGVELASYRTTFASDQEYQARAAYVIGSSAGLVVVTSLRGYVGPGIAREVRLAMTARLPVVALARRGLAALMDCHIEPLPDGERRRWRELRVVLPPAGRPSVALRASLRAMGVTSPRRPSPNRTST